MEPSPTAEWWIETWKNRHEIGYFQNMIQHENWKIQEGLRPEFYTIANPRRNDICLDIGCGYGEWMIPLAKYVHYVCGVDIHPSLVEAAKKRFSDYGAEKKCEMLLCNGWDVPYKDASFTLVYSLAVFYHLPKDIVRNYLRETFRVLKPGGRCVHETYSSLGCFDDMKANHVGEWSVRWSPEEIRDEMLSVGLVNVQVHDCGDVLFTEAHKE